VIDPRFSSENGNFVDGRIGAVPQPETTGRQIVVFADTEDDAGVDWGRAGISSVADTRYFTAGPMPPEAMQESQATVFANLGIAVVAADPNQVAMLQTAEVSTRRVLSVSPELVHHVLQDVLEYARAYRDGVDDFAERVLHAPRDGAGLAAAPTVGPSLFDDTAQFTWGIQAVEADSSPFSGRGINVAVLDTGFDLVHPDFMGRTVTAQSFVPGEQAQDGHGHGTHCIGTSCGPRSPSTGPRYGVAYEADIFVGKVLSNAGSGTDGGILAGIDWAVGNGCAVISMSLGADVMQAHPPYSAAGRRALEKGSLIIAAAGNNADRRAGRPGDHGRRSARPAAGHGLLLRAQPAGAGWPGGHRGPGLPGAVVVAVAHPVPVDQRDQHGDAARRGCRGAVGRGDRTARAGAVGDPLPGGPAAGAAVGRRRQRALHRAPGSRSAGVTSGLASRS
jgi:hypothetical protein